MMKHFTKFAAVAALSLVAGVAQAATQVFTTPFASPTLPLATSINLGRFDTTLGTLTSIKLEMINVGLTGILNVNNFGAPTTILSGAVTIPIAATGPDATAVNLSSTSTVFPGIPGPLPSGATAFTGNTVVGSSLPAFPAIFAPYEGVGPGTYGVGVNTGVISAGGSSPGNLVFYNGNGSVVGTVRVTYTYDANAVAPEPASLALLAMGALGMVARRRRAK